MLSKLFNSAVTFFHPAPPTKGTQKKQLGTKSPLREMVTTRGQSGKHAIDTGSIADDAKVVGTPSSSRKRQRKAGNPEVLELRDSGDARTPATKKQKILSTDGGETRSSITKKGKALPVRAKDDETPSRNTRAVVEIPAFRGGLGSSGRKSRKPRESPEKEEEPQKSDVDTSRVEEVPDSESESNNDKPGPKSSKSPKPRGNKKMEQKGSVNKETSEATEAISSPANIPAKPKHKRFGSEEPETLEVPEVEVFSTAPEILELEDESSDDDAPEVVGAQEALETAKLREREAAKAVEV
jgi:U3 small nucleolar RNA-associated protein 16